MPSSLKMYHHQKFGYQRISHQRCSLLWEFASQFWEQNIRCKLCYDKLRVGNEVYVYDNESSTVIQQQHRTQTVFCVPFLPPSSSFVRHLFHHEKRPQHERPRPTDWPIQNSQFSLTCRRNEPTLSFSLRAFAANFQNKTNSSELLRLESLVWFRVPKRG